MLTYIFSTAFFLSEKRAADRVFSHKFLRSSRTFIADRSAGFAGHSYTIQRRYRANITSGSNGTKLHFFETCVLYVYDIAFGLDSIGASSADKQTVGGVNNGGKN